jgi:hypothetical protein
MMETATPPRSVTTTTTSSSNAKRSTVTKSQRDGRDAGGGAPIIANISHFTPAAFKSVALSAASLNPLPAPSWFKKDEIHEVEKRALPEFFSGKFASKTPEMFVCSFIIFFSPASLCAFLSDSS